MEYWNSYGIVIGDYSIVTAHIFVIGVAGDCVWHASAAYHLLSAVGDGSTGWRNYNTTRGLQPAAQPVVDAGEQLAQKIEGLAPAKPLDRSKGLASIFHGSDAGPFEKALFAEDGSKPPALKSRTDRHDFQAGRV